MGKKKLRTGGKMMDLTQDFFDIGKKANKRMK